MDKHKIIAITATLGEIALMVLAFSWQLLAIVPAIALHALADAQIEKSR